MLAIAILGGLLIMMGQHDRSEALFYYFRLEDQIPETHLLRLIEKHISFAFVREQLKGSYSETGRPSIDPELLLRILLIGYLYGISSERKLVEELRMHLKPGDWFTESGLRSRDSASLHIFQEPARTVSGIRSCSRSCLNRSCGSAWKWGWCRASTRRWMAASWKRMQPRRAAFHVGAVGRSSPGPSHRATVSAGTGTAEPGGRTGA